MGSDSQTRPKRWHSFALALLAASMVPTGGTSDIRRPLIGKDALALAEVLKGTRRSARSKRRKDAAGPTRLATSSTITTGVRHAIDLSGVWRRSPVRERTLPSQRRRAA